MTDNVNEALDQIEGELARVREIYESDWTDANHREAVERLAEVANLAINLGLAFEVARAMIQAAESERN